MGGLDEIVNGDLLSSKKKKKKKDKGDLPTATGVKSLKNVPVALSEPSTSKKLKRALEPSRDEDAPSLKKKKKKKEKSEHEQLATVLTPVVTLQSLKKKKKKDELPSPIKPLGVPVVSSSTVLSPVTTTPSASSKKKDKKDKQEKKARKKPSKVLGDRVGASTPIVPVASKPKKDKKNKGEQGLKQTTLDDSFQSKGASVFAKKTDPISTHKLESLKKGKKISAKKGTASTPAGGHQVLLKEKLPGLLEIVNPAPVKSKRKSKKVEKGAVEKTATVDTKENSKKKEKDKEKSGKKKDIDKKKKKRKMDVMEKTNNNQKFFGQTIDISDNSSDSAELKIATNEDDESSELSSEYDSSDSEHIMKNIKSFNKKGASKTAVKKADEPPPPKPKPKIYSSSEDEEDSKEGDDEEEIVVKREVEHVEEEDQDPLLTKPDSDEFFYNGWTKANMKELLTRIHKEIPNNDNIKASTRVKQLNWENIKFGDYTASQCLEKWKSIEKKIRGYRVLEEILVDAQQWLEQPWTDFYKGSKKAQRHPEMPKRPLTSYMIFYLKKKDSIAKEFPGLSLTDLSKVIAERFNKLAPTKKAKYNELALAMKEDYVDKMRKFAEAHPQEMARVYNNGGRHRKQVANIPGWSGGFKPMPPLKLYLEDKMKQHRDDPGANLSELMAEYKEKWRSMSSKKKLPWIRWAHEAEVKYLDELKAYKAENPLFDLPKYKSVLLKEERNMLERMQGKPDKPPPSAYLLFSSRMLKDPNLRKLTPKERMQHTAKLWKNVSKVEKEAYHEQVKQLMNKYKLDFAAYLESLPEDKRAEEMAKVKRKGRSDAGPAAKRSRAAAKKPRLPMEEILKKEPQPPPQDAYGLFCQDYKDYSEKEIKKSWDALLAAPRAKYEARLDKMKQAYIIEFKKFLKSLAPEDVAEFIAHKKGQNAQVDVKLSESDGSDNEEEDGSEEEDDDMEEDEVDEDEEDEDSDEVKTVAKAKVAAPIVKANNKKAEESSDDSDEDDEPQAKAAGKSSSSSSSSESSSDEDSSSSPRKSGSSSSSASSSSSDDDEGNGGGVIGVDLSNDAF